MSRLGKVLIVLAALVFIGWLASSSEQSPASQEHLQAGRETFHGYDCTIDCSGHEAGYDWAEEHGITDGDDCDTAGEHSNSPSFAEGCHAYVDENDGYQPDDTDGPVYSGDDEKED